MPVTTYEIRKCESCGLRYPVRADHDFSLRCPICLGNTRLIHSRSLIADPKPDHPAATLSPRAALLDNVRSAWNVGSIFRSADGFGFSHIYLCGITPTPDNPAVIKTSLGAEKTVAWSHHKDSVQLVEELKGRPWIIHALEESPRAKNIAAIAQAQNKENHLLIVGNEVTGVDSDLLNLCDEIYHIPMWGEKKSFNVASAFAVAAYLLRA